MSRIGEFQIEHAKPGDCGWITYWEIVPVKKGQYRVEDYAVITKKKGAYPSFWFEKTDDGIKIRITRLQSWWYLFDDDNPPYRRERNHLVEIEVSSCWDSIKRFLNKVWAITTNKLI